MNKPQAKVINWYSHGRLNCKRFVIDNFPNYIHKFVDGFKVENGTVMNVIGKALFDKSYSADYIAYLLETLDGNNVLVIGALGIELLDDPLPSTAFKVGDTIRLKPSITVRPNYFNGEGQMDYLLGGKTTAKVFSAEYDGSIIIMETAGMPKWSLHVTDIELAKEEPQPTNPKRFELLDKAIFQGRTGTIVAYTAPDTYGISIENIKSFELKAVPKTKKVFSLEKWVEKRMNAHQFGTMKKWFEKRMNAHQFGTMKKWFEILKEAEGKTREEINIDGFAYEPDLFIEVDA